MGYSGTLVAGVWLGNDDGALTKRASGGNLPVEVWSRFMKRPGGPPLRRPAAGRAWKQLSPAPVGDPNFEAAPPMAASAQILALASLATRLEPARWWASPSCPRPGPPPPAAPARS